MPLWNTLPWGESWPWTRAASDPEPPDAIADTDQERALISAAQAGDERAFEVLFTAHHGSIARLAMRIVRDHDEAAEITQDVFLAAWQGLGQFRGEARFATWLHRIAYRRALRSVEARQQRTVILTRFASEQRDRFANAWSAVQSALAEQQWCLVVQEQIDRLPEKYRAVIALRHLQDLSYEEIAQTLTLPISSVKTQLHRARTMLRERLQALDLTSLQSNGATLRGRMDQLAANASEFGEVLRGHLSNVGAGLDALRDRIENTLAPPSAESGL